MIDDAQPTITRRRAVASVEDTVEVVVNKAGVDVTVGGTGSVRIDAGD